MSQTIKIIFEICMQSNGTRMKQNADSTIEMCNKIHAKKKKKKKKHSSKGSIKYGSFHQCYIGSDVSKAENQDYRKR